MSDEELHRVDTVPPPDGEGDAYNAPTRVGAGPPVQVLAELREAAAAGRQLKPQSLPRPTSVAPPASAAPAPLATTSGETASAPPASTAGASEAVTSELALTPALARVLLVLAAIVGIYALVGR